MNATAPFESDPTQRKKAVHVKWAGKTIALGTFPVAEADEKCARAKALTRAWRSTMRPKPSREWVMLELERLGVRVVSGKVSGGDDGGDQNGSGAAAGMGTNAGAGAGSGRAEGNSGISNVGAVANAGAIGGGAQGGAPPHRPLVGGGAAAAYEAARADHYGSMSDQQSNSAIPGGGLGDQPNRLSDMMGGGLGGVGGPPGATSGGMSTGGMTGLGVNPNQHYEMLKLHHMNLLNEIQETTLMMNLYQQQHLQQQQQQLQQQQLQQHEATEQGKGGMGQSGVSMNQPMAGPASSVTVGGAGGLAQGIAPGMGQTVGATVPQQQGQAQPSSQSIVAAQPPASQQQQQSQEQPQVQQKASTQSSPAPMAGPPTAATEPKDTVQKATEDAEEQLRKLKAEIAERERQMKALEAAAGGEGNSKRKVDGEGEDDLDNNAAKRSKTD